MEELFYTPFPHNENYELDLHRPYIDEVELEDSKGKQAHARERSYGRVV